MGSNAAVDLLVKQITKSKILNSSRAFLLLQKANKTCKKSNESIFSQIARMTSEGINKIPSCYKYSYKKSTLQSFQVSQKEIKNNHDGKHKNNLFHICNFVRFKR